MIISENNKPTVDEFRNLMFKTDTYLNADAVKREDYYTKRSGNALEEDVYNALLKTSKGTKFEDSIRLVSGAAFPDITAYKYYGVEVKSTVKNHWKSIGSSILESTRDANVERIFMTFGKLGKPVQFRSRPYEEVLSGISVTHYPRYQIDMELKAGETIFDKMGIDYDTLRKMDNPVAPVSRYYKSRLKEGESLWWAADTEDVEENATSPILRLWTALSAEQKNQYTVEGYALFPEILSKSTTKYQRYALWLVKNRSIVNTNIRDQFSAGGQVNICARGNTYNNMPAAYGRIANNRDMIVKTINSAEEDLLKECWQTDDIQNDRIKQWCNIVSKLGTTDVLRHKIIIDMLYNVFGIDNRQ